MERAQAEMAKDNEPPRMPPPASREALWTLLGFRSMLGLWLLVSPLVLSLRDNALGISDVLCGLLVLLTVGLHHAYPRLRFALLPMAVWLGFSPFVFDVTDDTGIYSEFVTAKVLLLSAFVSPEMFD